MKVADSSFFAKFFLREKGWEEVKEATMLDTAIKEMVELETGPATGEHSKNGFYRLNQTMVHHG